MGAPKTTISPGPTDPPAPRAAAGFWSRNPLVWAALLFLPMLLPIWLTPQPALGDYTNHLLQANVVLRYDDPTLGYAASYELAPFWYLKTTALSTLLLVGLGTILPITLAGRVVLTLYLVLFCSGVWQLLARTRNHRPLLLAMPLLAYNFTFTTGFINFAYGLALGSWALVCLLRWRQEGRPRDLWITGGLMVLTCLAHVLAWLLWLFVLAALTSGDRLDRRAWARYVALTAGALLLALSQPALALAALAVAPGLWGLGWFVRRVQLPVWVWVLGGTAVAVASYRYQLVTRLPESLQQMLLPDAAYSRFDKQTMPLKLLTYPHQFAPPDPLLTGWNLALLVAVLGLVALLLLHTWRCRAEIDPIWPRTVGLLLLVYLVLPTRTYDIVFVEPRVLIVTLLVALAAVPPLPAAGLLRRAVTGAAVVLALVTAVVFGVAAVRHGEQVAQWQTQFAELAPSRNLLVIYDANQSARNYPNWLRWFTTVYDGRHLTNLYGVQQGGIVSVIFENGPVRLRPDIPLPGYWVGFDYGAFVAERCPRLHEIYGAVVAVMDPLPDLSAALDQCFGPQLPGEPLSIWRH